jgi:hypothetical protein
MITKSSRWSGTDLIPLPFESTVSSLWRFGWRNKLNAAQLMSACRGKSGYPSKDFFDKPDWINAKEFFEHSQWMVPSAEECEFTEDLHRDFHVWVDRTFRYCPLCLEHGYHSFLFQLIPLSCCPIHQVELSTRCHCCNSRLPGYGFSRSLFEKPYYCTKCQYPICGAHPTIIAHLEFRDRESELVDAFQPLMTWWKNTRQLRLRAYEFNPRSNYKFDLSSWCRADEFVRSIACSGFRLPRYLMQSGYTNITLLSWKVRIYEDENYFDWRRRRSWNDRVRVPSAVYRCTLRLLEEWIAQHEGLSKAEYGRHANFELIDRRVDIRNYCPRLLALCLMRWQLESRQRSSPWRDSGSAQLYDEPQVNICIYLNRTPRLAWRAIFLGIYASWYHRLQSARRNGVLDLRELSLIDDAYVFSRIEFARKAPLEDWALGEVAYPAIDGLASLFRPTHRLGNKV